MTAFITQATFGPVIGSMVSGDKGNFSNRTKCAGSQLVNNLSTTAQGAAVFGGGYLATKAIAKSPKAMSTVVKVFDKVVSKLPQSKVAKLLNLPGRTKLLAFAALPAILLLNYIAGKHIYKMGQIDQKYTDKAKLEQNVNKNILA